MVPVALLPGHQRLGLALNGLDRPFKIQFKIVNKVVRRFPGILMGSIPSQDRRDLGELSR